MGNLVKQQAYEYQMLVVHNHLLKLENLALRRQIALLKLFIRDLKKLIKKSLQNNKLKQS